MRHVLLDRIARPPSMVVIAGLTGSGKTDLIRRLAHGIDLEGLACHRGSSFGALGDQPSQATFENQLALSLLSGAHFFVEDESAHIGKIQVPASIIRLIRDTSVIWLVTPLNRRLQRVFTEYVMEPCQNKSRNEVHMEIQTALTRIKNQLGGKRYADLAALVKSSFSNGIDWLDHREWIELLLIEYYDPMYRHAFHSRRRKVIFQGDIDACQLWIQHQFA